MCSSDLLWCLVFDGNIFFRSRDMAERVKFDVYYGHGIVRSNLSDFAFVELELLM